MRLERESLDALHEDLNRMVTLVPDNAAVEPDLAMIVRQCACTKEIIDLSRQPANQRVRNRAISYLDNTATTPRSESRIPAQRDGCRVSVAPRMIHRVNVFDRCGDT